MSDNPLPTESRHVDDRVFCRVIRATSVGRGAVASLLIVGRDVFAVLEPFLVLPSRQNSTSANVPVFAYFHWPESDSREEVVLHFRQTDMIELHCHGGDAVVEAIENSLVANGASRQTWDAWLCETSVGQTMTDDEASEPLSPEAIRRDALRLLPLAETEWTARLLWTQYHGALSRRFQLALDLLNDRSKINATEEAVAIINSLLDTHAMGKRLVTPFRVSLVGEVNAGKSSLMNALLGFRRSITSPVVGTTRDAVSAKTVIDGWPVVLVDTAGLRETSDPIEREGISRTQAVMNDSDLVLHIVDASRLSSTDIAPMTSMFLKIPHLHVFNKIDLVDQQSEVSFLRIPGCISVSAKTGDGVDRLYRAIVTTLCGSSMNAENAAFDSVSVPLVFTQNQYSSLIWLRDALLCGQ